MLLDSALKPYSMHKSDKIHIFLADSTKAEHAQFQEMIDQMQLGWLLTYFENGAELAAYLESETKPMPHMVFIASQDLHFSARDTLRKIRSSAHGRSLPIAIYSSSASQAIMYEALLCGANVYLRKPERFEEMSATFKKAVQTQWLYYADGQDMDIFLLSV